MAGKPPGAFSIAAFHDSLRKAQSLSDAGVRVALLLSGYADADGRCWPSQRRVARELGWCLRKTQYAFKELQRHGTIRYLSRARHQGEKSIIQLLTGVKTCTGARTCTSARWS